MEYSKIFTKNRILYFEELMATNCNIENNTNYIIVGNSTINPALSEEDSNMIENEFNLSKIFVEGWKQNRNKIYKIFYDEKYLYTPTGLDNIKKTLNNDSVYRCEIERKREAKK